MIPNDRQVGGDHYRKIPGEQHWDRVYRLYGRGYFIGCATKYLERYRKKGGKQDLEKAVHFIQKLISLEYPEPVEAAPTADKLREYEARQPTYLSDEFFLCEGGYGDGTNLYTHRKTGQKVRATGLQDAAMQWAATPASPASPDAP